MATPISVDVMVGADLPRTGQVDAVLEAVSTLSHSVDPRNDAPLLNLPHRLGQVHTKLQQNDLGASSNQANDQFLTILQNVWLHLHAYENMKSTERLLNLDKLRDAVLAESGAVEELFGLVGLPVDRSVDWQRQNEIETAAQRKALEAILTNAVQVLDELRHTKEQADNIVLLKAEVDKMQLGESRMPESSKKAVKNAFNTIVRSTGARVKKTPEWLILESDVSFETRPIGRGAFATVHRGKYRGYANVVFKMLLLGGSGFDEQLQNDFFKEVELWFTLRHPHIIQMIGANHAATRPFIVMNEATHGNLVEYLARGTNYKKRWQLLHEAALGVEFLHGQKIAHADLKLNNILVAKDGKALVTDFGLSAVKSKSKSQSMTKRKDGEPIMGGLRWLAPERFTKTPQLASDVYSFAMTILEAFLGEPPYAYLDDDAVTKQILKGELPARPDGLSDDAWELIKAMTVVDLEARITMKDVVPRLKALADNELAVRLHDTISCAKCSNAQREGARFCDRCGIPVSEGSPDGWLSEIGTATSPESRQAALQKLYRHLASSGSVTISQEDGKLLVGVVSEMAHPMSALYAFGFLRRLHEQPNSVESIERSTLDNVRARLCDALKPDTWKEMVGASDAHDELAQVELVELLIRVGATPQSAHRHRITELTKMLRGSDKDSRTQGAALAALIAVVHGNENHISDLREKAIGQRLFSVLTGPSSNNRDKIHAAMLLSGLTNSVLSVAEHLNVDDVKVLLALLHDGTPELREYVPGAASLVQDPINATVFIQAGGMDALETIFTNGLPDAEVRTALSCLQQIVAHSKPLGQRVASNRQLVSACMDRLQVETKEQRHAAVAVLLELVKTQTKAIEEIDALDGGRGFVRFMALIKDRDTLAEETLVQAIKTLLRESAKVRTESEAAVSQPDEEPPETMEVDTKV